MVMKYKEIEFDNVNELLEYKRKEAKQRHDANYLRNVQKKKQKERQKTTVLTNSKHIDTFVTPRIKKRNVYKSRRWTPIEDRIVIETLMPFREAEKQVPAKVYARLEKHLKRSKDSIKVRMWAIKGPAGLRKGKE